jgi:hypothetical protein
MLKVGTRKGWNEKGWNEKRFANTRQWEWV